jgi:hypothetical protein
MSSSSRPKRFTFGGVTAVLATVVALLLGAGPVSAQQAPPGLIPEGDWTQPQIDWLVDWIRRTETTLPQRFPASYTDSGSALEAQGYVNLGATAPGGYDHWTKVSNLSDSHFLNPAYPEALLYQDDGRGTWTLQAALFMLPVGMEMDDVPPLVSWIPNWHGHPELCTRNDGTLASITDPNNPNCPPGSRQASTPLMTHVWLRDPGCGHRFAGVGVSGLECEVHDM